MMFNRCRERGREREKERARHSATRSRCPSPDSIRNNTLQHTASCCNTLEMPFFRSEVDQAVGECDFFLFCLPPKLSRIVSDPERRDALLWVCACVCIRKCTCTFKRTDMYPRFLESFLISRIVCGCGVVQCVQCVIQRDDETWPVPASKMTCLCLWHVCVCDIFVCVTCLFVWHVYVCYMYMCVTRLERAFPVSDMTFLCVLHYLFTSTELFQIRFGLGFFWQWFALKWHLPVSLETTCSMCIVLQCVAMCYITFPASQETSCRVLQCVAVCCSVLQSVAVCCSVLQCAAVCCSVLQSVVLCCNMFQCVAVCCSAD